MHIHFLATFIFIFTYSTLLILASPTKTILDATKSGNGSETSANNVITNNTQNAAITSTNKKETPIGTGTENTVTNLTDNTTENEATSDGPNKPKNETSKPSHAPKNETVLAISGNKDNMTTTQNTTIASANKNETTVSNQDQPDHAGSGFHGLSFFVGILFSVGVMIVSYGCYRHYKTRTGNTPLLRQDSYSSF